MAHTISHHAHHDSDSTDIFGFWLYILSDCLLFATIFATFAALHNNVAAGPRLKELIDLPYVFVETMALLASSFTYGMAILALYKNAAKNVMYWLLLTCILGFAFIGLEVNEFVNLVHEGHSWQTSASLSSFFTLVGTHGCHVAFGLLWMMVLMLQISMFSITPAIRRRLAYLGLFWSFLDIVWIFVFTIVYLMGAI